MTHLVLGIGECKSIRIIQSRLIWQKIAGALEPLHQHAERIETYWLV